MAKQIAVLIGSQSKTSVSRATARFLEKQFSENIQFNVIEISHLPLYERDFDEQNPSSYEYLRSTIKESDAVLFITPEHNATIPATIKNVVDIVSRPSGQSLWIGKKTGIVTVGAYGGVNAGKQLQTLLAATYVATDNFPTIVNVGGIFKGTVDEQGEIIDAEIKQALQQFAIDFAQFIN